MFEAIATVCALSDPTVCRDMLLPGLEAATLAGCDALVAQNNPDVGRFAADYDVGPIRCEPQGRVAVFANVAPGVFVHLGIISDANANNQGDVANLAFVIGESAVAVIDSGGSRKVGEQVYRAIRQETDLPISHVILTHMHPDHVLGAGVFAQVGAQVVGHDKLPRALADREQTYLTNFGRLIGASDFIGTQVVLPDITVTESLQLDLGNRPLNLQAWPTAHTGSDLTVGDPTSGILFTGDLMFHQHAPALDGSVLGWEKVLEALQDLPYNQIMPGHGGPIIDWPEGAAALSQYLDVLIADTRAAITRGDSLGVAAEIIAQSQSGAWDLFDLFNPRNATVAFTELEWE
ncbi:quinoprotein relay system zinc metallohydrolase 2 [Yoonia sediminilitoris]|uniref:Quinoprotein relay system zinc metallohydrolase 2 n=1 Tax=Yoonia sediminilitoris TaxID=1286148 RepID=A0A2T6KSA6_9RHOB|nr:quinoprotein relay system zinc metallohydrolase 2 [Yoonia sediminilitoris]PUB19439.1 quinoprotein relay system zinc metallohydrolase 2 [Yoonia sediminilitoris]RCW99607.1 quinoprotein relay system zinc metallohydrolase 2 [Yoonia sediminilitoris]